MKNWQTFFDHHAPAYMQNVFTRNTLAEVDFLLEVLGLPPGSTILDLGCGTGRHSVTLAKRGYRPTGLDLSAGMLAEAEKAAHEAGVSVEWIQADAVQPTDSFVARLGTTRRFDAALCLCEGAFGLIDLDEDPDTHDPAILRNIHAVLRPGGPLVLTALNGLRAIRQFTPADVEAGTFDPLTLVETYPMEYSSSDGKRTIMVREKKHLPQDLARLCREAGFEVEHIWGGTAGDWGRRAVKLDEMEIMIVARRR
jgi:cyclopropane fatty-acyl-phospholipid synthase-like methyltransferase